VTQVIRQECCYYNTGRTCMLLLEPTPQRPPPTFRYPNFSGDVIRPDLSICHPNLNDKDNSQRKRWI